MVERVTRQDIEEAKRRFLAQNLRLTPVEAAAVLRISVRTFYSLVEEGLIKTIPLRPGQVRGMRCTMAALEEYQQVVGNEAQGGG